MEVSVSNLAVRSGKFQFRYRLPANYLPGKIREIRISLRTNDLKKAMECCKFASDEIRTWIDSGEYMSIPLQDLRKLAADYITRRLEDHTRQMAAYGRMCPETRAEGMRIALNMVKHFENAVQVGDPNATTAMINARDMLKEVPHDQGDLDCLAHDLLYADLFVHRMQYERIAGRKNLTEYNEAIYDKVINGDYPTVEELAQADEKHFVGKLIQDYLAAPHPTWGIKTREDIKNTLDLFLQYVNSGTDIKAIRHRDLLAFRDNVLMKIPARRNVYPELKDLPLSELVKDHGRAKLSDQTVNHNCVRLGGFFKWCFDHEYLDRNPATNLLIDLGDKVSNERSPYSTDDLKLLLANIREDRMNAWKPHKYWIPLIALFSGLRQAEICQLYPDDIINVNGIPCFDIKASVERKARLKNKNAKRTIPVHPILQQLGLLEFVQNRASARRGRKTEDARLWICLEYTEKYGYTHSYEKSFGRFNRKCITDDTKKVFHSLRHNVANCLKQKGAQESLVAEIMGHSLAGMSFGRYGKAFNPEILLKNLKLLDYNINVFEVLGKTPLPQEVIDRQIAQLPVLNR